MLPQSLKLFKQRSVFIRLLILFNVFVLFTILAFGYASYSKSSALLTDEVVESNNRYIEQARDNVDHALSTMDNLTYQVSLQPSIRRALYLSEKTWDLDQLLFMDNIDYLKSIKLANPLLADIWIQFYRYPVVLNNISKYNTEYFYQEIFQTDASSEWREPRKEHIGFTYVGRQQASSYGVTSNLLTFARTAPLNDLSPMGILYINVKAEDFSKMIQRVSDPYPAFIYTMDKAGNVVFGSPMRHGQEDLFNTIRNELSDKFKNMEAEEGHVQAEVSGQKYEIVFTSSQVSDWKYISVVPTAFITEKVSRFRQFTIMAALLCLVIGGILSYGLTNRIYRPIHKIVDYIQQFDRKQPEGGRKPENELEFINRIINFVYYENSSLRNAFHRNLPALQHKVLNDLLENGISSGELERLSEEFELPFAFDSYQVIVFELGDFTLTDTGSSAIEEMIRAIDNPDGYGPFCSYAVKTIRKRSDMLVSILNIDRNSPELGTVYEFIHRVTEGLQMSYSRSITVGVGKLYARADDIPSSYAEALRALQYKIVQGEGTVIFVEEVGGRLAGKPIYSLETEKHLVNLVKTGNRSGWSELLETLWEEHLDSRSLTPEMIRNLFHALAGTAVRTVYEVHSSMEEIFGAGFDLYQQLDQQPGLHKKKECMEEAFGQISGWILQRKQGQSSHMFTRIKAYVEQNYAQNLSLTVLGDALGLSPSYLSSIFKEITGMNCVDYINSKRVEEAKALLSRSGDTITDISDQVGFTNSNTFIRVFKKYEGVTPGQFRQMQQS
ncbi:AraC-like DNA-binding protein [Bacillus sp. 3255]|nr:AraC-like DNA-binding protein [Bacillus sp. 3255]